MLTDGRHEHEKIGHVLAGWLGRWDGGTTGSPSSYLPLKKSVAGEG
jgi:hypothetical protein